MIASPPARRRGRRARWPGTRDPDRSRCHGDVPVGASGTYTVMVPSSRYTVVGHSPSGAIVTPRPAEVAGSRQSRIARLGMPDSGYESPPTGTSQR